MATPRMDITSFVGKLLEQDDFDALGRLGLRSGVPANPVRRPGGLPHEPVRVSSARAQRDCPVGFRVGRRGKGGTRGKQGEHVSTGERTYLMPESMSPPLAATPCGSMAATSGSVPPRSPETSLQTYSKPLIRHLPSRGWARGAPRNGRKPRTLRARRTNGG